MSTCGCQVQTTCDLPPAKRRHHRKASVVACRRCGRLHRAVQAGGWGEVYYAWQPLPQFASTGLSSPPGASQPPEAPTDRSNPVDVSETP